jgi:hypothetical protein
MLGHLAAVSAFADALNRGAFWTAFFFVTLVVYAFHGARRTDRTMFSSRSWRQAV